jgi:hypothetical protein
MSPSLMKCLLPILLLIGTCFFASEAAFRSTRMQPPIISSVTPAFGSISGGSRITISGANFATAGLFTTRAVFIAGQQCQEISYYTNDEQIVCVVPSCIQQICRNATTWSGSLTVSLDVYVQNVETIYNVHSTWTYSGSYTPAVYHLSKNIRGSAVSFVQGRMLTPDLADLDIKVADNSAFIGDPGEINPNSISMWSSSQQVFYKPPADMEGGFYNLSVQSQNDQTQGWRGTGFARMFSREKAFANWGFPYNYNFDSSLSGTVYNVFLQPVVTNVVPNIGSIVGGTEVTITGTGFSKDATKLTVLVSGQICDIKSTDYEKIVCVTRAADANSVTHVRNMIPKQPTNTVPTFTNRNFDVNSTRDFGSSGWWVKIWNMNDFYTNKLTEKNVRYQFGWKSDMLFSLSFIIDSNWPSMVGYSSQSFDWRAFTAYLTTYMIAPVSGRYRFVMNSDDDAIIYITQNQRNERSILSTSYSGIGDIYTNLPSKLSSEVYFNRGERVKVRVRLVNIAGPDFLKIGLMIRPNETMSSQAVTPPAAASLDNQFYNFSMDMMNDPKFMHHHALRTIQIVSLSFGYRREIQVRFRPPTPSTSRISSICPRVCRLL